MSGFGFSGNGPAANGQPRHNDGFSTQNNGPRRDAWNNPIRDEPAPKEKLDADGKPIKDTNASIDDDTIGSIWKEVVDENSGKKDLTQTPPVGDKPDPKKQLDDYLASQGLDPIVLSDVDKEELKNGNFDNLMLKLSGKIQQAHVKGLSSSQTMIEAAVTKAVEKAVGQSRADASGRENLNALHSALPFTKDPAIGPVAQTVMQKFLDRKMSTEDAIKGVKKFFDHTAGKVTGSEVNRNRSGNYQSARDTNSDGEGRESWLDILSPGQS